MNISELLNILVCPNTRQNLLYSNDKFYTADQKYVYPVVNGIPRFVESDFYVKSFSFEWNIHNQTQIDIFRGDNYSEKEFLSKTGFTKEELKGKLVLDAGVGAGRFAEVISRWGAKVVGIDLSYAVEAAYKNLKNRENVYILQADIAKLPFSYETFDYIFSIGVLHHTPNTKEYFKKLVPFLKPGGEIAIWVYPKEPSFITRSQWIPFTNKIPTKAFYEWCKWFVPFALKRLNTPLIGVIKNLFPFSHTTWGVENDILDTFHGYSPKYHGIHSPEEVREWFLEAGLKDIYFLPASTSVRGKK